MSPELEPVTEQRQREIMDEYAARRTRQLLIPVVFGVVVLSFLGLRYAGGGAGRFAPFVGVGFLVLLAGAIWFSYTNWRCPACEKYLGRSLVWSACPHCGVRLR